MADCRQCADYEWCAEHEDCGLFKTKQKQTHYDRIVSKSPEELAEFMWIRGCPTVAMCDACIKSSMDKDCKECWLDWLKEEVDE